jgi:hypothetical protein
MIFSYAPKKTFSTYSSTTNKIIKSRKNKDTITKLVLTTNIVFMDDSIFLDFYFNVFEIVLRKLPRIIKNKNISNIFVLPRGYKKKFIL